MKPLYLLQCLFVITIACFLSKPAKIYAQTCTPTLTIKHVGHVNSTTLNTSTTLNVCESTEYVITNNTGSGTSSEFNLINATEVGTASTNITLADGDSTTITFTAGLATANLVPVYGTNCTIADEFDFTLQVSPVATANVSSSSICEGATFNLTGGPGSAASYSWVIEDGGNSPVTGATSTAQSPTGITTGGAGIIPVGTGYTAYLTVTNSIPDQVGGGQACTDVTSTASFDVVEEPQLNSISFGGSASEEICIYNTQDVSIECTNCNGSGTYDWRFRASSGTYASGFTSFAPASNNDASETVTAGTGTSETSTLTIDPEEGGTITPPTPAPRIIPGTYDIRVVVTLNGCTAMETENDDLVINDRPAVKVMATDESGKTSGTFYSDDVTESHGAFCVGETVWLQVCDCYGDRDDVAPNNNLRFHNPLNNYSTVTAGQRPNLQAEAANYNRPCVYSSTGVQQDNGYFYKTVTWSAEGEDGTNLGSGTDPKVDNLTPDANTVTYPNDPAGTGGGNPEYLSGTNATNATNNALRLETSYASTTATLTGDNNTTTPTGQNYATYTVTVEGANGCENTDTVSILVQEPSITFVDGNNVAAATGNPAGPVLGCVNGTADITAELNGVSGSSLDYTWTKASGTNGLNAATANSATMEATGSGGSGTTLATVGSSTIYNVIVTDPNTKCSGSADVELEVVSGPAINMTAPTVCEGQDVVLVNNVHTTGYTYEVFTSSSGGTAIHTCNSNCATIVIPNGTAAPTNGKTYYVEAINGDCRSNRDAVSITVNPKPTLDDTYPDNSNWPDTPATLEIICSKPKYSFVNYSQYFYARITNGTNGPYTFNWIPNGNPTPFVDMEESTYDYSFGSYYYSNFRIIAGLVSQTFDVDGTEVKLVVEDGAGCPSDTVSWKFDIEDCGQPVLNETRDPSGSAYSVTHDYACEGDQIQYSITGVPGTPGYGGSASYTTKYDWSAGTGTNSIYSSSSTFTMSTVTPDTTLIWVVVYKEEGGVKDTIDILYDYIYKSKGPANVFPTENGPPDTSICANGEVIAAANCPDCLGNIVYVWNDDLSTPGTLSSNLSGPISTNGPTWMTKKFTPVGNDFEISLRVKHGDTLSVSCVEYFQRDIEIDTLPQPQLRANGTLIPFSGASHIPLCNGDSVTLEVDAASCGNCQTYQWNTSATTPSIDVNTQGGYYLTVYDANTCFNTSNVALVVEADDGLNAVATASPSQLCSGNNATLEVTQCPNCTYTWHRQPSPSTIASGATHTIPVPGDYYAVVTNQEGCQYQTSDVTVSTITVAIPNISGSTDSICAGQSASLSTTTSGTAYQWYRDGTVISGASTSTYTASQKGDYTVRVTYANGCEEESPIHQLSDASFKPNINALSTVICSGETADLQTNVNPSWTYQWYRDGILISGSNGSTYSANAQGTYYVEVTNSNSCVERSDSLAVTTSSLSKPNATANTPSVCEGELGVVSVSLCSGCSYQWFEGAIPITTSSTSNYRYDSISTTGDYYAVVTSGACSENSDTVTVTVNTVITPAITSTSSVVCDGLTATLTTPACVNCDYSWLIDGVPVIGSLDDTFHIVSNVADTGDYQIAVTYPNGCADTSQVLTITSGAFDVNLAVASGDSVICNGAGETLIATENYPIGSGPVGTYNYTLFLNNSPVTGYTGITSNSFPGDNAGFYTVQVVDPLGCTELSNIMPLREVNIYPSLEARATADTGSISASAICGPDGTVFLEASNCPDCDFQWKLGPDTIVNYSTRDTLTSSVGSAGTGTYIVQGRYDGCVSNSDPVSINDLNSIDIRTTFTDTSICNGKSVTVSYDSLPSCPSCAFRWMRSPVPATSGVPINGATNPQFVTNTPGYYTLEITDLILGCVDTSNYILIREINPPSGLALDLDSNTVGFGAASPIAASGSTIDLNNWIFPSSARMGSANPDSIWFTSSPYSGAIPSDAGLENAENRDFNPDDTLSGFHLITYHFDTVGCEFTVSDVLEVLPSAGVTVYNNNPASVPYEACVNDTLTITTTNLDYAIDTVWVINQNGGYQYVPLLSLQDSAVQFGIDTVHYSTITLIVPDWAKESSFKLGNFTTGDTTLTDFVLIHNQDLQFTGLPNMLCSNGNPITLTGTPSGGVFYVTDSVGGTMFGATVADTLYPTNLANNYADGAQNVNVIYSFTETYTNGNLCPDFDTVVQQIQAREVFLNQIVFNDIAVSQDQELLTNLVDRVYPQRARANRPNYTISFSGSFTNPAGNPTHFLPKNAGIGNHTLTYSIQNGDCINSVVDSITVIPAPTPVAIPDTICSNFSCVGFGRDAAYTYQESGAYGVGLGYSYDDTTNIIKVYSTRNNQAIDTISSAQNLESYTYCPSALGDSINHDTIVVEYWFARDEDSLGNDFDSLSYVIGRVYQPIVIEQNIGVDIDTNVVQDVYCEKNILHLLRGTPQTNSFGGGYFTLTGGTGAYATEDTLTSNVLNPYAVHNMESGDVTYDLIYYLNGSVCSNSDTMPIIIPERVNTNFTTATGSIEFCDSDQPVAINHSIMAPDTAIWKIGGVPQASYQFQPIPLDPGIQVVEMVAIDSYGCNYSTVDTFTIHALPNITANPMLDAQYCTNDAVVPFDILPIPDCPDFDTACTQILVDETFDTGIPATWTVYNQRPAEQWQPDAVDPQSGGGCVFVDTTRDSDTRTTLVTDTMFLKAGHTYRITFLAKTGVIDPGCSVGTCNAKLRVLTGTQNSLLSLTTVPGDYPQLDNDAAYVPISVDYTPISTGPWFLGLQCYTEDWGRWLRVDELKVRDITVNACDNGGIGYISGPGAYNVADSLFEFNPAAVDPGTFDVKYYYTNTNGCTDSLVQNVTVDDYPTVGVTDLDSAYCDNLPPEVIIGTPAGGYFTNQINGNLSDTTNPQWNPATYTPTYGGLDTIKYFYTDPATLCSSMAYDVVVVNPIVDSAMLTIDQTGFGFCESADSVLLDINAVGSPVAGVFSGNGVRNDSAGPGASSFHPDLAVQDAGRTGDMTITYIFSTTSGCVDTTRKTVRVHADPDLRWMNLPDSLCVNADTIQVQVVNNVITGALGNVSYDDTLAVQTGSFTTVPSTLIGLSDYLVPSYGTDSAYTFVTYQYVDGNNCDGLLYDSIRMDTVPVIKFDNLQPYYCENDDSSMVIASPPFKIGSGYLEIDYDSLNRIDSGFYWVHPAQLTDPGGAQVATHHIYYTYTDTRGCTGDKLDSFEVRSFPRIDLAVGQDSFCRINGTYNLMDMIADSISYGYFRDNLALTSITQDSLLNLNALPGPRLVTYYFTDSNTLCSNNDTVTMYLFNTPDITFEFFGGCVGSDVTFNGQMTNATAGIDSISNIGWDFGDGTIVPNAPLGATPIAIPTIVHQYGASGRNDVILTVTNQGLCSVSDTQEVIVSPSWDLDQVAGDGDYFEDFEATDGEWYNDQPLDISPNPIWQHGLVNGARITDPANNAWVTMGDSSYQKAQSAWIYTPCYDFTNSQRPMVAFDLWRDMLTNIDGVVMEYYNADSMSWEPVGTKGWGINWYQSDFVLARPGDQQNAINPLAWTGLSQLKNGTAWESARFRLDPFIGHQDIRFRIAFASSPQTVLATPFEGAAVDNFWLGERTRNVLVEHYSNENYIGPSQNMHQIDQGVYNKIFNTYNGRDVMLIEYHINAGGVTQQDKINVVNQADANARQYYYGVNSANRYLLDGAKVDDGESSNLQQYDLDYDMLQFPEFDITIDPLTFTGTQVTVNSNVEALKQMNWDDYVVHTVIIQDSFATDYSGNQKQSVMRKMLPSHTGSTFQRSFNVGDQLAVGHTWDWNYSPMISEINPGQIEAVVFIQSLNTDEIYQAATTQDLSAYIGVDNIEDEVGKEITDLKVYPNPANAFFNVEFSKALEGDYDWRLVDAVGRTLQTGRATQGTETFQVNADRLTAGTYFFVIHNDKVYTQRKVVIFK